MSITHHILVEGNSLSFRGGFFGFSSVVLLRVDARAPILFDTGHHSTRLLLLAALERHGLAARDIDTVFLSHLHFDHANNIELFPDACFYVGATELAYADEPATGDAFCSPAANEYLRTRRLQTIADAEGELAPGLYYRHAPGHTPGSYLLHYQRADGKRVVLASDACKTYREIASLTVASEFDPQQRAGETLRWIAEHADIIVPGHFPELHRGPHGWLWEQPTTLELIVR